MFFYDVKNCSTSKNRVKYLKSFFIRIKELIKKVIGMKVAILQTN